MQILSFSLNHLQLDKREHSLLVSLNIAWRENLCGKWNSEELIKHFLKSLNFSFQRKQKGRLTFQPDPFLFFSKALRKTFCKQWVLVVIVPPLCPSSCQKQHFNGYRGWRLKANERASKCWLSHISGWLRPDHIQGGSRWGSQALRLLLTEFYSCSVWNIAVQVWKSVSEAFRKSSQKVRKRVIQP